MCINKLVKNYFLSVALLWGVGGCANQMLDVDNIHGSWLLVTVQSNTGRFSVTDHQARFTLNLSKEGSAFGIVACNGWRGKFKLYDESLSIPMAMSTRKYCLLKDPELKSLESRYLSGLKNAEVISLNANSLTLAVHNLETWHFKRVNPTDL